jgi:hypothetical protein
MANPNRRTLDAVRVLQDHHEGDAVVFYNHRDGESAVVVVNDPAFLEVLMVLMNYSSRDDEIDVSTPLIYTVVGEA